MTCCYAAATVVAVRTAQCVIAALSWVKNKAVYIKRKKQSASRQLRAGEKTAKTSTCLYMCSSAQ